MFLYWEDKLLIAFVFCLVVLICVGAYFLNKENDDFKEWCTEHGGHTESHTQSVYTASNGYGSTSATYCLTDDGRILKIL